MRHPRERLIRPGGLSRRDFLRFTGGVAGGVLLSACGGAATTSEDAGAASSAASSPPDDTGGLTIGSPGSPVEQPLFDDIPAIESGLEIEEGPLQIYNWADYLNVPTLKKFAKEFDEEGATYPLGEAPAVVTGFKVAKPRDGEPPRLLFHTPKGEIGLTLEPKVIHVFARMLAARIRQSGWDLEVAGPAAPEKGRAEEPQRGGGAPDHDRPRRMARSISRSCSRLRIDSRLSTLRLPRASASSTLARPFLK